MIPGMILICSRSVPAHAKTTHAVHRSVFLSRPWQEGGRVLSSKADANAYCFVFPIVAPRYLRRAGSNSLPRILQTRSARVVWSGRIRRWLAHIARSRQSPRHIHRAEVVYEHHCRCAQEEERNSRLNICKFSFARGDLTKDGVEDPKLRPGQARRMQQPG